MDDGGRIVGDLVSDARRERAGQGGFFLFLGGRIEKSDNRFTHEGPYKLETRWEIGRRRSCNFFFPREDDETGEG